MIEFARGAENNGLGAMMAQLIEQNLQDKPEKRRTFEALEGRLSLVAEDAQVSTTLQFQDGRLIVHDGIFGVPDVTIRAPNDDLIRLSLMEVLEPDVGQIQKLIPKQITARALAYAFKAANRPLVGPYVSQALKFSTQFGAGFGEKLKEIKLPLELPDPRGENVRSVAEGLVRRRIKIFGALRHPKFLLGVSKLLSVH